MKLLAELGADAGLKLGVGQNLLGAFFGDGKATVL